MRAGAPKGLVGVALAIWGLSIGHEIVGLALGLVVEAARLVGSSWRVPSARLQVLIVRDFVALAAVSFVFSIVTGHIPEAIYGWLRWLPPILAPIVVVRALAGGTITHDILLEALRPGATPAGGERQMPIDVNYAFAALTAIAAATGPGMKGWFYLAIAMLVAWVLASRIPPGRRAAGMVMLVAAIGLGFGVHRGLAILQGEVEEWSGDLLKDLLTAPPDPFRERTRIGDLGRVKLSNQILMRVVPEEHRPPAVLLREAAFERYQNGEWVSASRAMAPVPHEGHTWRLKESQGNARVTLRRTLPGGQGLLALPAGTTTIERLVADGMERHANGAVVVKGAPRSLSIRVTYDDLSETRATPDDLVVPELLAPTLARVLATERLERSAPGETVAAVTLFFARKFSYTLALSDLEGRSRTIADFLLTDRKGHCEYFATATVLLLRQAGIPARYTVGYSVQEYSPIEGTFIVRARHAHAWASAYVGGRWIPVDTTPSRWAVEEAQAARGFFAPLLDLASVVFDRAMQWWTEVTVWTLVAAFALAAAAIAVPWALMAAWARWRKRVRVQTRPSAQALAWRRIEKALAAAGLERHRNETPREWAQRVRAAGTVERAADLPGLAQLYYRSRLDPAAGPDVASEFLRAADEFLRAFSKRSVTYP